MQPYAFGRHFGVIMRHANLGAYSSSLKLASRLEDNLSTEQAVIDVKSIRAKCCLTSVITCSTAMRSRSVDPCFDLDLEKWRSVKKSEDPTDCDGYDVQAVVGMHRSDFGAYCSLQRNGEDLVV